ncbi:MAG: caspase family protein [Bacteroidales bacterium]
MKRFILLISIAALPLVIFGQSASKFIKAGDTFFKNNKFEDAVEQYTHAIELNPTDIKGYILRCTALEAAGRYQEAYEDIEKARVFDPKDVEVLYLIGRVCNELGKYDEALMHLNYASRVAKREEKIYPEKVKTLIALGQYDNALKVSDTALLFKENELNFYQRGLAFEKLNNDIRARKDYEKAISKEKTFEPARLALADLLIRAGELEEAKEHVDYLIADNDRNANAYLVRSRIYVKKLDYPSALNDVSRNILLEPENPLHYATRGLYYQEFNQHANAINDFSKAISLNDSDPDLYFKRAYSYEQLMNYDKAALDYKKITELSEFDMRARKMLKEANDRLYEINRETVAPVVTIASPVLANNKVEIRGDSRKVIVSGSIKETSDLKSLSINGNESLFERGKDGVYEFLSNIDIDDVSSIHIVASDIYNNVTDLNYEIYRTETAPPVVTIVAPYASDDGQISLQSNSPNLYIEGRITDDSKIKSIFIEGVTASYPVDQLNPTFTASIDILNKNRITVIAEDYFGNRQVSEFTLNRDGAAINETNPMGKTWVVFIENSNYSTFASLDGPVKDVNLMKRALANYQVHNIIHKKDLTKDEMEKFFSIELRDLIRSNQVKSLLVWYAGHGKFVNDVGYWIPIDAKRDDEFTYFNINTLRAAMEPYVNILTHTLVVTDACESGPSFYTAMRSTPEIKSCDDWEATQFKSSQVFMSAGYELAADDSQFTRTFANALSSNPNACIPIEEIVSTVTMAVTNNNQQKPRFGKIAGLRDENGTFFFIAK